MRATSQHRSKSFHATRSQHHLEAAEDYTELVDDLIQSKGEARVGDIAKNLGVSHVTAIRTISRLEKEGYLKTAPREPVTLTAKGKKLAQFARYRHDLVVQFLRHIGVPRDVAEVDAEGAEHHISKVTLKAMSSFLKGQEE